MHKKSADRERFIPEGSANNPLLQAHIGRYVFASQFVNDKVILDVASGTGYGSHYLANQGAAITIGAEIALDAIDYAKKNYQRDNLYFTEADATRMPFKDHSFDMIVSFETIEHIEEYETFLSECARILRKDGSFLCSTPNKNLSFFRPANPYHAREFYPVEFLELLRKHFNKVDCFGQINRPKLILNANELAKDISKHILGQDLQRRLWIEMAITYERLNSLRNTARKRKPLQVNISDTNFEDALIDGFKVTAFTENVLVAPRYVLALCKEPKKHSVSL
jgi:ubiquinone/menaquinone biosynthesis C-methylase UbiE